jgi:ketosteroid isomerase-like protein
LKKVSFCTIAIFFATLLHAQQLFPKQEQEIQHTVVNMFQALSNRDSIALKYYCSPDVTLYEYGQIWNIDTLIKKAIAMNQSADFERTNTFEFINTASDKTNAWVTYRLNSVITKDANKTTIQWLETVVLTRQNRQWKIKHLHSTMIKKS